jgi:hypothetical protein
MPAPDPRMIRCRNSPSSRSYFSFSDEPRGDSTTTRNAVPPLPSDDPPRECRSNGNRGGRKTEQAATVPRRKLSPPFQFIVEIVEAAIVFSH